eukprot:3714065-Pyramimonas_sp.AAC.1
MFTQISSPSLRTCNPFTRVCSPLVREVPSRRNSAYAAKLLRAPCSRLQLHAQTGRSGPLALDL